MPRHLEIAGGRPTGKPKNWDEATQGECGTLSVLYVHTPGQPQAMISAWQPTPAETQALEHGGVLFLKILGQQHPVIALWVQDASGDPIDLEAEPKPGLNALKIMHHDGQPCIGPVDPDSGLMLALVLGSAYQELERQAEGSTQVGDLDDAGMVWINGMVDLKALAEAALEAARPAKAASALVELPVMTLDAIGADAQLRKSLDPDRRCRECGCGQFTPCSNEGNLGCWWTQDDLCSYCDPEFKPVGPIEHPACRDQNTARCPAPECRHGNPVALETLRETWQPMKCGGCGRNLEVCCPGLPRAGVYAIDCRRAGE